jgi:hypothetical protein
MALRVILRLSCRALLIVAACVVCAAKLHSRGAIPPIVATQELNRCLSLVVRAAARKGRPECAPTTPGAATAAAAVRASQFRQPARPLVTEAHARLPLPRAAP